MELAGSAKSEVQLNSCQCDISSSLMDVVCIGAMVNHSTKLNTQPMSFFPVTVTQYSLIPQHSGVVPD